MLATQKLKTHLLIITKLDKLIGLSVKYLDTIRSLNFELSANICR